MLSVLLQSLVPLQQAAWDYQVKSGKLDYKSFFFLVRKTYFQGCVHSQSINGLFHFKKPLYNTSNISSMLNFSFFGAFLPSFWVCVRMYLAGCDLT